MIALLDLLLILHLAGLVMGFVGGRAHGEIVKRLAGAGEEAAAMLWDFEKKASNAAFIGTGLLVVTGAAMLWLKYGGPAGQPPLFFVKLALVVVVAVAEIVRHLAALRWKRGEPAMARWARLSGKVSGLAAALVVVAAVVLFH